MADPGAIWLASYQLCAKMNGPGQRANVAPALDHATPEREVQDMTHYGHYGDSVSPDKPEQSDNWKSIGDLAKKLAGLK